MVFDHLANEAGQRRLISATGVDTGPEESAPPYHPDVRLTRTNGRSFLWHPGLGEVSLPPGAQVVSIAVAPGHPARIVVLLRRGTARRVVCLAAGESTHLDGPVTALGPWQSTDEVLVIVEAWPNRVPYTWNVRTGTLCALPEVPYGVVDDVVYTSESLAMTWTSTGEPRRLLLFDRSEPGDQSVSHIAGRSTGRHGGPAPQPVSVDSPGAVGRVGPVVVEGSRCALPCLVHVPDGPPRGTVVLLHGGPNGTNLDTWSPLADALVLGGWQVVRPNIRGSAVADPEHPLPNPDRYGQDDVDDVVSVIRQIARGPVVVGGHSYGGYLASRTAHVCAAVRGAFVLCGFLCLSDIWDSQHEQVRAFLRVAGERFAPDVEFARVPYFLAHGEQDPRIPAAAIEEHARRLPADSDCVIVPGEGHGILSDHAARKVFRRLFSWLDRIA